ncbi:PD40 domain-containing protein [Cohnella nanjingensis]|uniref:PD40 domain-containing protein n=1 Tax=Cohnella nanjingensis TaxID=1387779 RepID=A0A7X0VEX8_9BACL|nr:PD40 domain-containing protein [Cohnella nanjingensis]MBB6671231.1 PD40 domain-containing protein [Cohnella nanjingensis]
MAFRKSKRGLLAAVILASCVGIAHAGAAPTPANPTGPAAEPTAAFVRSGDLWVKSGGAERPLTRGEYVRNPKWSHDGGWIAFTRGKQEAELWVLDVSTGASRQVATGNGKGSYRWSPSGSRLAYLDKDRLYMLEMQSTTSLPVLAASDIDNFAWLPDGTGFLASSSAHLIAGSWTPVRIGKIRLPTGSRPGGIETLYVLPAMSNDFFAVGTSTFKWSADGKWIAFIAHPTASLSADADYLCVLSADGRTFKQIDQMLAYEEWFSWGLQGEKLAYIAGVGRETTQDKKLKVVEAPNGKPVVYTPSGFVDQSFAWHGDRRIVVSRAPESQWSSDPAARPLPFLAEVSLDNASQEKFTSPGAEIGDYQPLALPGQRLAWVRSNRSAKQADVMLAGSDPAQALRWIRNLDPGTDYYEHLDWSHVLQFKGQRGS